MHMRFIFLNYVCYLCYANCHGGKEERRRQRRKKQQTIFTGQHSSHSSAGAPDRRGPSASWDHTSVGRGAGMCRRGECGQCRADPHPPTSGQRCARWARFGVRCGAHKKIRGHASPPPRGRAASRPHAVGTCGVFSTFARTPWSTLEYSGASYILDRKLIYSAMESHSPIEPTIAHSIIFLNIPYDSHTHFVDIGPSFCSRDHMLFLREHNPSTFSTTHH